MQFLDRCETDVDGLLVDSLEIFDFCDFNMFSLKIDILAEKVFCGARVEEVILGFFDDVGRIDEKEEVAVAFLIEIEDQARHDERFTATCRHIEQQMYRFFFTREVVIEVVNKTRESVFLVGTEFKRGIQILRNTLRHFGFGDPKVERYFELFMKELLKHQTVPNYP